MNPQLPGIPDRRPPGSTRYIWLAISAAGTTASFFINLYIDTVRQWVEWTWARVALPWVLYSLILIGCCFGVWRARGRILQRRWDARRIVERNLSIYPHIFDDDLPDDTSVIGRKIHYLERVTDSPILVICLHGLGLDASDYRRYMHTATEHTVAITQYGFNVFEAKDPRYKPISLTSHAELISGVIRHLQHANRAKKLILVGFSLGADLLLRLTELWREEPDRQPAVAGMLLLDPNINHSTMIVSSGVSQLSTADPLAELKRIANLPHTLVEFQNITEYLHKITVKNLDQVRQFAADMYAYWEPDGHYDRFLERIGRLRSVCPKIKVVFSVHYEDHFNDIVSLARQRKLNRDLFTVEAVDHFDLLDETLLRREVAALAATGFAGQRSATSRP
ncbi:alpha/beta hydrolase [Hamadaea sp. NPDC051192]|uniref:alpha/beta fold hydrolase n=1 Tax=Hamadaea sp. NPDC051192 TaxID=3154940 RepID=UPI0034390C61